MLIKPKLLLLNDNMKTGFIFFLIIMFFNIISCNNKRNVDKPNKLTTEMLQQQSYSLHFLDSIHCSNYYMESKWKIYIKYCDKKIVMDESGRKIKSPKFFGEADIYLQLAHIESDTLLGLLFEPVLLDSIPINHICFEDSSLKFSFYCSHYYNIKHNGFYGYGFENGMFIDSMKLNDFCNGVPNCNKKEFIEKNRNILNKWFIEEAIKRKFIHSFSE